MLANGDVVTLSSGRKIQIEGNVFFGAQGQAYVAIDSKTRQKGVLKVMNGHMEKNALLKRTNFLISAHLQAACPVLYAPIDVLNSGKMVGHFSPFATGISLEKYLQEATPFLQNIQLATAIVHAIFVLHARGITHGDLHSNNVIVSKVKGGAIEVALIDMDNFNAFGSRKIPEPACVGHPLYIAPELDDALESKRRAIPTLESELYALGVLLHEILLLRHPIAGFDNTKDDYHWAKHVLEWPDDPMRPWSKPRDVDIGGYPTGVLSADFMRLFRRALSKNSSLRPQASEWKRLLVPALGQIYTCPSCGTPVIVDSSKTRCPYSRCGKKYPHLVLKLSSGKPIQLQESSRILGRDDFDGAPHVSREHCVVRRRGPETFFEAVGRNGMFRMAGKNWLQLQNNRPFLVQAGDRLRFANVEAWLDEAY
jgi:serine/threonine protein kinase